MSASLYTYRKVKNAVALTLSIAAAIFGPLAEAEAEGVDGNGFACPRLPCDAGHAGLQIEFEKLDDGEVVDGQLGQHGLILYGSTLLCMHPVYTGLIYSKVCVAGFFAGQGIRGCARRLHRE